MSYYFQPTNSFQHLKESVILAMVTFEKAAEPVAREQRVAVETFEIRKRLLTLSLESRDRTPNQF
jgi:hypothetical protein